MCLLSLVEYLMFWVGDGVWCLGDGVWCALIDGCVIVCVGTRWL